MKLSYDELDLIRDSRDTIKAVEKILEMCIDRHKEKLMTEPLDQLVHLRLKVEGMKVLLNDLRQTIKNNRP